MSEDLNQMVELRDRIRGKIPRLQELEDEARSLGARSEADRLKGKRQGFEVTLSYIHEVIGW